MSWNAIISGELRFKKGGLARWQSAEGILVKHRWPSFLARTVEETPDEEDEPQTVAARLQRLQRALITFFVDLEPAREEARIRAQVTNDDFWFAVNEVVRTVGAATKLEASGRIFLRYDGAGWGHDDGAILKLTKGKLTSEPIGSGANPNAKDRAAIDEAHMRAREAFAAVSKKKKR